MCVVSFIYSEIIRCKGVRTMSTYPDIDSVRIPISDSICLPGGRIFRDCVSWYMLCLFRKSVDRIGFTVGEFEMFHK